MWARSLPSPLRPIKIETWLLVLSLLLFSAQGRALSTVEHSFEELVARSDTILVGTVARIDSFWGEGTAAGTIFSHVHLHDLETIKGAAANQYRLRVMGGSVGDEAQFYPGLPEFHAGQRYLLFINGNERAMYPITGVGQGVYNIQWDEGQQRQIAVPSDSAGDNQTLTRHAHRQASGARELGELIGAIRGSLTRGQ